MPAGKPTVARISLDVDVEQKQYLQMFSLQNGIPSSVTMRCLIYLLEVDVELQNRVIDEIFLSPDEVEVEYEGAAVDAGADVGEIES